MCNVDMCMGKGKCMGRVLTICTILAAEPNLVGNFLVLIKEFVEGCSLLAFDRWQQILSFSCWTSTTIGEDWKGPLRMRVVSSREKGPSILPAITSSLR